MAFSAQHHLTASDAETLTVEQLLAYADPDERAGFERLPLSCVPTWGGEELRAAIADLYEGSGRARPHLRRRRGGALLGAAGAPGRATTSW